MCTPKSQLFARQLWTKKNGIYQEKKSSIIKDIKNHNETGRRDGFVT